MAALREPSRAERIEGAIWGLLVGDALGVPYEFAPPQRIPAIHKIDFQPPSEFLRAHWGIPIGTWSDDGAQALCLLDSLQNCGHLDPHDLMDRFCRWYRDGYLAVGRDVFDVGMQTRQALEKFLRGTPALQAAPSGEWSNGNGSLMRVLPLALWHTGSDEELYRDCLQQSLVTHGHVRAGLCCALLALWARRILEERSFAWDRAVDVVEKLVAPDTLEHHELHTEIKPREDLPGKGSGYVVDCLRSVRQVMNAGSYEAVVRAAVALGNDTDTTACIAGGIAGLRDGVHAIPTRWRKALRGKDLAQPLLDKLLYQHASLARD